jgi:hypothetical protein
MGSSVTHSLAGRGKRDVAEEEDPDKKEDRLTLMWGRWECIDRQ